MPNVKACPLQGVREVEFHLNAGGEHLVSPLNALKSPALRRNTACPAVLSRWLKKGALGLCSQRARRTGVYVRKWQRERLTTAIGGTRTNHDQHAGLIPAGQSFCGGRWPPGHRQESGNQKRCGAADDSAAPAMLDGKLVYAIGNRGD